MFRESMRQSIMQDKTRELDKIIAKFSDTEMNLAYQRFPELVDKLHKAQDIYNAQAIRWVNDLLSPEQWADSDACLAATQYGYAAEELKSALAFC